MKFNEIISISGKSGLFRLLNTRGDGIIVQNLEDDKSAFVSTRIHNVITLDNIAIYREHEETTPLREVLISMKESESKHAIPETGSDEKALRSYIEKILPDYDKQRVHLSDLKKLVKWYHIIQQKDIMPEAELENQNKEEAVTEDNSKANEAKAVLHLYKALEIHPTYTDPYLNLGTVYNRTGEVEKAEAVWNEARKLNSTHPKLTEYDPVLSTMFLNQGLRAASAKNYDMAFRDMRKATKYNPKNIDAWYNIGGAYFTVQKLDSAVISFRQTLILKPDHQEAQQGLNAASNILMQQGKPVPQFQH